ncbi:MAG: divalent metal cation transporter [Acidobacteriota bacterium]
MKRLLGALGPGILLAATSVGASHILLSPEAGARFGVDLVWLIVLVHVIKYPAFAFAPRYVAAQNESLLDAYAHVPGPRNWAVWLGLGDMALQAIGLIAALVGLTASFLVVAVGGPSLTVWSLLLTAVLLVLLRWGRYRSLRLVNLVLMLSLVLGTVIAFTAAPPSLDMVPQMLTPSFPAGSLLLVAAILGFMPTSVGVSIWQSLWALEHRRLRPDNADKLERLRNGLLDVRLGYGLSVLLAVLFVSLGAVLLAPRGLVPEGPEVALTLSRLYTLVLGDWMQPVFLAMAFCALFTTCYTMMDGFPRSFIAALRVLRGDSAVSSEPHGAPLLGRPYWVFLLSTTFLGMAILALAPDPALLVKIVGAFGLLLSPVYYALNLWAVTRRIEDPRLRPDGVIVTVAMAGIVFMVLIAGLLLWTTWVEATSASLPT